SQTSDLPICPSCAIDECNLGCDQSTGTCTPKDDSTPCTDTDGNVCTIAGCEIPVTPGVDGSVVTSVCVQDHMFAHDSTPCPDSRPRSRATPPPVPTATPTPARRPAATARACATRIT